MTTAGPGREFAFSRTEPFAGTVVWHYQFEPEGNGTQVTESYEVTRPVTRVGWFVIEKVFGCPDRRTAPRRDGRDPATTEGPGGGGACGGLGLTGLSLGER